MGLTEYKYLIGTLLLFVLIDSIFTPTFFVSALFVIYEKIKRSTIDNITYTFQDYAQQNHIRYLKDETVSTRADGFIKVNNKTLSRDKELLELKFAASEMRNTFAFIPIYTANEDGDTVFNKLSSRVLDFGLFYPNESSVQYLKGAFSDAMFFRSIDIGGRISEYYSKYQEILLRPKVIEATFLLNGLDLYNIDLITPIYLAQTGHYYAIIEIKVGETHSTCKLLQM